MQDTERCFLEQGPTNRLIVSTHSIRCRILKDKLTHRQPTRSACFNPFDPMQDTEREDWQGTAGMTTTFQPIRSDAGY